MERDRRNDESQDIQNAYYSEFFKPRQNFTLWDQPYIILGDLCSIDPINVPLDPIKETVGNSLQMCALIRAQVNSSNSNMIRCWRFDGIGTKVWTEDLGAQFEAEQISCGLEHGCAIGTENSGPRVVRCWGYDLHSL